jgi:hypothetical protein
MSVEFPIDGIIEVTGDAPVEYVSRPASMPPLEHALALASMGFAVFPIGKDKAPRCPRGHKAASTDPDCIRAMAGQYGFVLVGVATGEASNAAVLDLDRQHGAAAWWTENRHRLPATRTHRTRSGGLHLWFRHKPDLRCSTAKIAPGVDVKAEGGACIWWPATGLPALSTAPLAPWPDWLAPPPPPPAPAYVHRGPRPAAHIEAQLAGLVRVVAASKPGQRNASLFWAAARAGELVAVGELSKPHAESVLLEAAAHAGLDRLEAGRTIKSAFDRRAT